MNIKLGTVIESMLGPRPLNPQTSITQNGERKVEDLKTSTALTAPNGNGVDPFIAFASGADGVPLKYDAKVGSWKLGLGADAVAIPNGTLVVGQMGFLSHVWSRWQDQKRTGRETALIGNWETPLRRDQLGDLDRDMWETDDESGEPKDCWQMSFELPMTNVETDELWIYSTASKGGINAIRKLSGLYGRGRIKHPDCYPVIELGSSSYQHSIRSRGTINIPLLTITDWQPRVDGDGPPPKSLRDDLNDEIPL